MLEIEVKSQMYLLRAKGVSHILGKVHLHSDIRWFNFLMSHLLGRKALPEGSEFELRLETSTSVTMSWFSKNALYHLWFTGILPKNSQLMALIL